MNLRRFSAALVLSLATILPLRAGAEGDPKSEVPVASRTITLPLGSVDAVTGQLSFRIPLGPKLPGRIPLGFTWTYDSQETGGGACFRPVVWPGGSSSPIQVTVMVGGEPWAFYTQAAPSAMPSVAQITQWAQDRGVQMLLGPSPSFWIVPSSDGTKFYVEVTCPADNTDLPPGTKPAPTRFYRMILSEDSAIWAKGNSGGVGFDGITHFTNRWGDKVSVTESNYINGWIGSPQQIVISNDLNGQTITLAVNGTPTLGIPPPPYIQTYGNDPQPGAVPRGFLIGGASLNITNNLVGSDGVRLPSVQVNGQITGRERMDTTSYPGPPVIDINTGLFDESILPTSITVTAQDGAGQTTTAFNWPQRTFTYTPAMSGPNPGTYLDSGLQSVVLPYSPDGGATHPVTEAFSTVDLTQLDMSSMYRVMDWDPNTGLWSGIATLPNLTNPNSDWAPDSGPAGVVQVTITGTGSATDRCIKFVRDSPLLLWHFTDNPSTHPSTSTVLVYGNAAGSGAYRGVRFTFPSSYAGMVGTTDIRAYLFATQAVLAEEKIHGTGAYSASAPTTAIVDQLTVHDGWSLKSWSNPNGILSTTTGIPATAVALRTRTWTAGSSDGLQGKLPTRTTIASGFDGWGPTRTDEYTEDPTANAVATSAPTSLGDSIGIIGDIAPPAAPGAAVSRTGVITRHGDGLPNPLSTESYSGPQGLMEIHTDTDTKSLSGAGLTALRGTSSVGFGTTSYAYDSLGRISSETGTRGSFVASEVRTYKPGLPLVSDTTKTLTGPNGAVWANPADHTVQVGKTYTYADTLVQSGPSTVVDKTDGRPETFQYDPLGRVTSYTDVLNLTTTTAYDGFGRVKSVIHKDKNGVALLEKDDTYDPSGASKTETMIELDSGRTIRTTTAYNAFGKVTSVTTVDATGAHGTTQSFGYDGFGQKVSASPVLVISNGVTQASWGNELWNYDAIGQVTDQYDAQNRHTLHVVQQPKWGAIGGKNCVVTISQNDWDLRNGTQRSEGVDLLGQKAAVLDQGGKTSLYAYDKDGHLYQTTQTDPGSGINQYRTYTYNDMGWLTSRTEPEEGTTWYSAFNMLGAPLLTTQTGRSGSRNTTFTTELDGHLQPTQIVASGPEGVVARYLTYDGATHLLTNLSEAQANGSLAESYGYDDLFRVVSKTISDGTQSFTVSQDLDAAGRPWRLTYPNAAGRTDQTLAIYDTLGRAKTVTLNGETRASGSMVYDQLSNTAVTDTLTLANNAWTTSVVDKGELTRVTHTAPSGVLDDDVMAWSAGGLLLSRVAQNTGGMFNDAFGYDALQRLTSATVRNPTDASTVTQGFGYDAYGNRNAMSTAFGGAVPTTNEALTWTATYTSGNDLPATVTAASGALNTGRIYDDLGRMSQVWTTPGQVGTLTTWVYDPSGRVMKENGTAYLLDSAGLRFKRMKADHSITYMVYGFGREPLAQYDVPAPATQMQTTKTAQMSPLIGSGDPPPHAGATITQPSGPVTVGVGQTVAFSGSSLNGTSFTWTFGDGVTATGLTASHAFSSPGSYTVSFTASAPGYQDSTKTLVITVVALPSISSFTASPSSITAGQSSTLAWTVSNATSLSLNQGIGTVTGTIRSVSPTATTTYTLTATNAGGSVTATVTVAVSTAAPPTIGSFTASPATIAVGSSTALAWNVSNAASLSLNQGIGTVTGSSFSVSPTTTTTYTLTATNPTGSVSASITVSVETQLPVITAFSANPAQISSGQSSVLSWSVSQADSLKLGTAVVTGANTTVSPTSTTTYTLTATNLVGSVSASVTVSVGTVGSLAWSKTMVYGFGQLIREEDAVQGTTYNQSDQVGSPNWITSGNAVNLGAVVGKAKTLPFGEQLYQWGATKSIRRYTNHERDNDSNAIYMQAREYLAAYGKFAQVDPAYDQTKDDPESWNLYNYVTNNPVTHTDPDGRKPKDPDPPTDPEEEKKKKREQQEDFIQGMLGASNLQIALDRHSQRVEGKAPSPQTGGDFYRAVGTKTGLSVWKFELVDLPEGYEGCLPDDGFGVGIRAVDVTSVKTNTNGRVSLDIMSGLEGANFELKSNSLNRFMASKSAANMFNLAAEYGEYYSGSPKLFITDAGTSSGSPAPGHQTHNGSAFDVRYLDGRGNLIQNANAANLSDSSRMLWFIGAAKANGFTYILSSRPSDFGTSHASQRVYDEHKDHLHVGLHTYEEP